MNDCIDILRSIGATCSSLNQIGGVDKRVWVTQLNQIESYTFDSNGYLNSLVTKEYNNSNYRYELAQIVGKKNTHSGNYEGVVGANVSFVKQNAVLKIYTDTPSDRDKVVELFDAQELVIFFENNNGKIEVYGLDKGLEGSALVGGTGTEMQDDTAVTITLTGDQNKLPYFFLYGGSLATSIEYLDNIGLQPIYYIQSYTSGTSTIDFTNNGGDDWDVGFKISVNHIPTGLSVTSYDYVINFYEGGIVTHNESGNKTADFTSPNLSHGAGVYALSCQYNMTNGIDTSYIVIGYLIKVDASGNVLGAIKNDGLIVNSVNGLNIDYTADLTQISVSENVNVDAVDFNTSTFTNLSHSLNDIITLPLGTGGIIIYTDLDATFWADLGSLVANPFQLGNFYITTIS